MKATQLWHSKSKRQKSREQKRQDRTQPVNRIQLDLGDTCLVRVASENYTLILRVEQVNNLCDPDTATGTRHHYSRLCSPNSNTNWPTVTSTHPTLPALLLTPDDFFTLIVQMFIIETYISDNIVTCLDKAGIFYTSLYNSRCLRVKQLFLTIFTDKVKSNRMK